MFNFNTLQILGTYRVPQMWNPCTLSNAVVPSVILCQAYIVAVFRCCSFKGLSGFKFIFSRWNTCLIGLRSGNWLNHCIIFHFFASKDSLVSSAKCFGSLFICTVKSCLFNIDEFGWIWADSLSRYNSEFIWLLLSSVTSSLNTSDPVMCHHTTSTCFTNDVVCFGQWAVSCLLHTFYFSSFW